ncbi:sporulation and spore germination protein [Blastococcus colisei]|uniref:Sporulation and spore germination protein n=1 Tax=Blastococcus colisei TaxID=1564162 RepID=A0A543P1S3_9ACTN|nr:GerMN domain-containing protein [Blastococcus colisei]TQN38066.1 sporulation and spore germination protein [Blastococcus colisei]
MTGRRRAVPAGLVWAMALCVGGCGVPAGGAPEAIPSSEVPYGLAQASPESTSAPPASAPVEAPFQVFLVSAGDVLVGRPREVEGGTLRERLAHLLASLEESPTAAEREEQLSTVLSPEVRLSVSDLSDGTATIDLGSPTAAPSGAAGRRAVAQIVLTATSMRGVDAVRLTIAGDPVEAPLPTGELTSAPLTASDYATFLTAPEPPSPAVTAEPPTAVPAPPS